jgi:DNA-binding GntR family transcriptional regulator
MDAYENIKEAIIMGVYEAGQRLTEEHLAAEWNLSRTPIREALKRLESEGLIVSLKRGVSVKSFSKADISQIYDLRAMLEGYTASQAALHRTNIDLDSMTLIHNSYVRAIDKLPDQSLVYGDIKEIVRLNNEFHESIFLASKNDYARFLVSKVFVIPLVYRSFYWFEKHEMVQSMQAHQIILDAVQNTDPDRAKAAMLEHIYRGRDHVLRHIHTNEEQGQDEPELI